MTTTKQTWARGAAITLTLVVVVTVIISTFQRVSSPWYAAGLSLALLAGAGVFATLVVLIANAISRTDSNETD